MTLHELAYPPIGKRVARAVKSRLQTFAFSRAYELFSREDHKSLLGWAPVLVSLTSHGARLETVHLTIESIGRGRVRPSRIVLWVNDPVESLLETHRHLRRLQGRGLEVRQVPNYGPHTKYAMAPALIEGTSLILVTPDDDILYARVWLHELLQGQERFPTAVICHRAHRITLDERALRPYLSWRPCETSRPSVLNFATGVSGVLYPPSITEAMKRLGTKFIDFAPRADDVWLHHVALDLDVPVAQLRRTPRTFPTARGTQTTNLASLNSFGEGNDSQIRATYTARNIQQLQLALEPDAHR